MSIFLADLTTTSNLSRLSSIVQLIFILLKVSDAAPNTDTSVAPAAIYKSKQNKKKKKNHIIFLKQIGTIQL